MPTGTGANAEAWPDSPGNICATFWSRSSGEQFFPPPSAPLTEIEAATSAATLSAFRCRANSFSVNRLVTSYFTYYDARVLDAGLSDFGVPDVLGLDARPPGGLPLGCSPLGGLRWLSWLRSAC